MTHINRKLLASVAAFAVFSSSALGCDFSKDIQPNPDGSYTYSRGCHIEVGKRVKKLSLMEQQVSELEKTIELKDIALSKQKQRADEWMDSSLVLNEKLQAYNYTTQKSNTLHFILGAATVILSAWAVGQATK